ncbi:MAG: hypothetical protein A3I44_01645 [Candidatus Sungbacteria bacterium RIFCSPLOWO2_02_FULL_51_17]|nr:MAG: hypothetical protein A2676_03305 [Candidatus Sungbacteria bacterium RIFCSPHIGHO2_01_FULL_51_22]OHA12638.1 MAG: hypothetical protein A3I44_01645 [Candidatus Sungbacteria bacterium RIFCSPLOWO2_02_FULL_51_17]
MMLTDKKITMKKRTAKTPKNRTALVCAVCKKQMGLFLEKISLPSALFLCSECATKICFRCGRPIMKGTLYSEAKNGKVSHFGCVMACLGNALDAAGMPIGVGD